MGGISNQIDTLAKAIGELEEDTEIPNGGEEELIPDRLEEEGPFCDNDMEIPRREERHRVKRREKADPWGCAMDLS